MTYRHFGVSQPWLQVALVFLSATYSFAGFEVKQVFNTSQGPAAIAVADLNQDGIPDLAVNEVYPDTTVSLYWGVGDGTFQRGPIYRAPFGLQCVTTIDLNLDGKTDIVTANGNFYPGIGNITVFLNNGDGTFADPVGFRAGHEPHDIAVGDMNEDGIPDLAVAFGPYAGRAGVSLLTGAGDGTFQSRKTYGVRRWPQHIVLADFNLDSHLDVIAASVGRELTLRLGNGDGTLQEGRVIRLGQTYEFIGTMAAADFSGDGIPDLAMAFGVNGGPYDLLFLTGIGDGTFSITRRDMPFITAVYSADLNNDGLPDLVARTAGVTPLINLGNGSFRNAGTYGIPDGGAAALADLNGDGLVDIVEGCYLNQEIAIILNTGGN